MPDCLNIPFDSSASISSPKHIPNWIHHVPHRVSLLQMKLFLLLMTLFSQAWLRTATAFDVPSLDRHLWETFTSSLGSAFILLALSSLSVPQSRFLFTSWYLDHTLEANVSLLCSSCGSFLQWLWKIETVSSLHRYDRSSNFLHDFFKN